MAEKSMGSDTNVVSSMSVADLQYGNIEKPLVASGQQEVKVMMPMGKDMAAPLPKVQK